MTNTNENKLELNEKQKEAVNAEYDKPTIVTAAAGSGKTALLVERVVRLLLGNPENPDAPTIKADSIAVMTFTRKATKNLRDRLNKSLRKELEASAGNKERCDFISEQILLLRQAYISTIDSFCLRLIRENPEAFELPLNFTTLPGTKKITMQLRSLEYAMRKFYDKDPQTRTFDDDERDALFYTFNFENDNSLQEKIRKLEDTLSTYKDAGGWLDEAETVYGSEESYVKYYLGSVISQFEKYIEKAKPQLARYDDLLSRDLESEAEELFSQGNLGKKEETRKKNLEKKMTDFKTNALGPMNTHIDKSKRYFDTLSNEVNKLKASPSLAAFSDMLKTIAELEKLSKPSVKGKPANLDIKDFTEPAKALSDLANEISKLFTESDQTAAFHCQQKAVLAFIKLLRIYHDHYTEAKITSGRLDFSDCELLLMKKLIKDDAFREQISGRFQCVIVDEFQDSNDVQAEIFKKIGGEHLFYVGDIKQAIYGFRGGDPTIMSGLCEPTSGFNVISLAKNYRSREEVLTSVNYAFSELMTKDHGGVDYALEENRLQRGRDFPPLTQRQKSDTYFSELCFVSAEEGADKEMVQPRAVARRIRGLLDDKNFFVTKEDKDKKPILVRPKYSDFTILMRTKKNAPLYRKALAELGIPSTAPGGDEFFDNEEVKLILDYLIIIDNPQRNEELLNIIMSPIYRLDAEQAGLVRLGLLGLDTSKLSDEEKKLIADNFRGYSLYSCARNCCEEELVINDKDGKTVIFSGKRDKNPILEGFINDITRFRNFMCTNSIYKLVCKVCEETDLLSTVAAFSDSAQRIANVRKFQDMAAEFESGDGGSLSDFLRYIEYIKTLEDYSIEDAQIPESGNAVNIMTSHKSKGLEFPVCIVCELENGMSNLDTSSSMLVDRGAYLAPYSVDHKKRTKAGNPSRFAAEEAIKLRQRGEELRLLYVAMTRAQDKLIMFAEANKNKWVETAFDPADPDPTFDGNVPFKWIVASLMQYYGSKRFRILKKPALTPQTEKAKGLSPAKDLFRSNLSNKTRCKIVTMSAGAKPQLTREKQVYTDISDEEVKRLADKIGFTYKYPNDTARRSKYTATELAHMGSEFEMYCQGPDFARDAILGSEIGTAYHTCMQYIPLEKLKAAPSSDAYTDIIAEFIDKTDVIGDREKNAIKHERLVKKIVDFLTSDLGQRMLKSPQIFREDEFLVKLDGTLIGLEKNGDVKIQGIVDMYFIENGEIVIVDYKTDTVENFKKERENYKHQVNIYKAALQKKKKLPVKAVYLYTFSSSEEFLIQ